MKTQTIGKSELVSSRLSYGCMRVTSTWKREEYAQHPEYFERGRASILAAYEAGYTLFDHADIYAQGMSEELHGRVMKEVKEMRGRILIATKCGIRFPGDPNPDSPHRWDFSGEHVLRSCDGSLKRLGIETIDIYQLHRPDLLMDPAEVAGAFEKLHKAGKVRYFGVSNFMPSFATALQSALDRPLVVNQVEIHLGRLDCFVDGTLDQCIAEQITPLAWSPLAGGWLGTGGKVTMRNPRYAPLTLLLQALDEVAGQYDVSRTAMALAWLLKHPSGIIPIVGSNNVEHIRDAVKADEVELSREDWYRIYVAARNEALP
jgi:predicted oxidoreductase